MAAPTVLVTGATGFVGAHTAKVLVENGVDVIATDVSTDPTRLRKLGVLDDVSLQRLDLTDPTAVVRTVRQTGATRIIHLGAVTSLIAAQEPRQAIEVNVTGTNNVFEAARTLDDQIERVAWASTMAVYGHADRYPELPVDEDDLVGPDSIYGATKACCEQQAELYAQEFGVSLVGLRPTGVFGPFNTPAYLDAEQEAQVSDRSPSGRLANLFVRAAQEQPVSMTVQDGAMDWIYVEDVGRLFAAAALRPDADLSRRLYNAASGAVATVPEIADHLRELVPGAEIDLSIEGDSPYVGQIDGSAARADLGVTPNDNLRETIRNYVETIRTDQGLPPLTE